MAEKRDVRLLQLKFFPLYAANVDLRYEFESGSWRSLSRLTKHKTFFPLKAEAGAHAHNFALYMVSFHH